MRNSIHGVAAALLLCAAFEAEALPVTLLDNLSSPNGSDNGLFGSPVSLGGNAINITSNGNYSLESITALMRTYPAYGTNVMPVAMLFAGTALAPNSTLLATLIPDVSALTTSFQSVTFTGSYDFVSGVPVWLAFFVQSGSGGNVAGSIATSSAAFMGAATSNRLNCVSLSGGTLSSSCSLPTPGSDGLALRIIGSATVPEPGTLALAGMGLFGLGLVRRRRSAPEGGAGSIAAAAMMSEKPRIRESSRVVP